MSTLSFRCILPSDVKSHKSPAASGERSFFVRSFSLAGLKIGRLIHFPLEGTISHVSADDEDTALSYQNDTFKLQYRVYTGCHNN